MANSADPDQLASEEDLDLYWLQNRAYPGSTGLEIRYKERLIT